MNDIPISRQRQKKANREAILMDAKKPLTEEELARLERKKRSLQNRRGRKQPAVMPACAHIGLCAESGGAKVGHGNGAIVSP